MTLELIIFLTFLYFIFRLAKYALQLGLDNNKLADNLKKFDKNKK